MKKLVSKKQNNNLATKQDLKSVENYLDYKIEDAKTKAEEFRKEFIIFKDHVYKSLDWLVGAFKKFDEEHTVLSHKNVELSDTIENHESRIKTLEKKSLYQ